MRRWFERVPGRAITLVLLGVLAITLELILFGGSGGAGLVLLLLVAGAGASAAWLRTELDARVWRRARVSSAHSGSIAESAVVVLIVVLASALTFGDAFGRGGYSRYDWAPHHANLRHLVDALAAGHVPRWIQGVSTGDSPYELYPFFPYYLAARAALWFRATDLTLVLVRSGILIHTLAAAGAGLLARRICGWKWGIVIGCVVLLDLGSVFGGGANGIMYLGVTHSALATALWPFVMLAVLRALERPSLATSAAIWSLTSLVLLCHPYGTVSALATMGALVVVAWLASDVPRRRPLFALGHLALGVALPACIWRPFGERILLYGMHYASLADAAGHFFGDLLEHPLPQATLAPLVCAAYAGIVVGLLSRRAAPTLVACHAALLLSGLLDQLYLVLDLVPSLETARLHAPRLGSAAKASVFVCAAYLLATSWTHVAPLWRGRARTLASAVLALLAFPFVRGAVDYFGELTRELAAEAHPDVPDAAGFRSLIAWARVQNHALRPEAYARLLSDDTERYYSVSHVNAESGLPALWLGPTSALFLRERLEDESPASLRRFDVRWVMHRNAPPSVGEPSTERHFGSYFVREIAEWDGRFARVERGSGNAVVTRLDDERVEVELRDTREPALVALGMGYYPRWEAVHEMRGKLPVYAYPTVPGGSLRVPAAWLPPGRTTFQPSGALPSDRSGFGITLVALLGVLGGVLVWSIPRARARALRTMARGARSVRRHGKDLTLVAGGLLAVALLLSGFLWARRPTAALEVGSGLVPLARVEERGRGGSFLACEYAVLSGQYLCPSGALVFDTEAQLLNDAPPSTPFVSPAVRLVARGHSELRLLFEARLQGEYWGATSGPSATLSVSGMATATLNGNQLSLDYPTTEAPLRAVLGASLDGSQSMDITFVRRRRLEPARGYPLAPEENPLH
jgi:hypothetical protein